LDLETQEGQEYWIAMNLAGRYASANHHEIHNKIAKDLQIEPVLRVENHHNFAWSETLSNGEKVTIHRKGATPAHLGALGIIPGTMSTKGFLVRGKGEQSSLNSAAHGAGRRLSRTKAKKEFKGASLRDLMKKEGIYLMGAGLDEAPMAYKDIHSVMDSQFELVDVLGSFLPKIVKMADGRERAED
jgi:tRNA-splicing ligase RtcB